MAEPDLYVANTAATFEHDGQPVFIGPRTVVRAGHPIMVGRESMFDPLVVHFDVPRPERSEPGDPPAANAPKGEWVEYATGLLGELRRR